MEKKNPRVDGYIGKAKPFGAELAKLRTILLGCDLTEEIKWRQPCYTLQGSNVAIIARFKEYSALLFMKGALLSDPQGLLETPGENTQSGRRIRFTNVQKIVELEPALKALVESAIAVEKAGLKVELKKITERKLPAELQDKFRELPALKAAFQGLTPGRQRAYLLHFSGAKQSQTRSSRIEKCMPMILQGKGLND